jgi:hypothetical protein
VDLVELRSGCGGYSNFILKGSKAMEGFWRFLMVVVVVAGILALGFLILLSLPKSRLRSCLLEIFGWGTTAATAASVVSPVDPIPDLIPLLGHLDDVGAVVVGLLALGTALFQRSQRAHWDREAGILVSKRRVTSR